jgi:L-lysine 6-transaminase
MNILKLLNLANVKRNTNSETNANEVISTLKNKILADPEAIVVDLKKSQGSWVVDARTGKQYLDCFSQFASQPLGWNNPKMLCQKERLLDSALHKVANSDMYTTYYADFVKKFGEITEDFKYNFYVCGGALAVENGLKAAFDWKLRKTGQDDKFANKLQIIYLREAFHGRSGYTISITNNDNPKNPKVWGYPKFNWTKITNPKVWHNKEGIDEIKARNLEIIALEEAENQLIKGNVAAVILEPIQGEGGDNHFRSHFLKSLKKLCNEYQALLIFDEVQTGLGLTGKMWAYKHFDVVPDIMCFGKKVQVCGICSGSRIDEVKDNVFKTPSRINSTWGGNLVDMVRSTMQIEIIQEDNLVENAAEVGDYFLEKIKELESNKISNVRGKGLMIAFDFETSEERDGFLGKINENVLLLPCGKKSVRFRPHLTFSKLNVDEAIGFIKNSL